MTRPHVRLVRRRFALALPALAWLIASSPAVAKVPQALQVQAGATVTPPPLPPPQLTGQWNLNVQASDPTPSLQPQADESKQDRPRGEDSGRGRRARGMSGESGSRSEWNRTPQKPDSAAVRQQMERALEAPNFFVIVQHEGRLVLTDDQGRVTTLKPDGTKVVEEQAGASVERTTRWADRALVTTMKLGNGARVTQTFTKVFDGLQMVIVTRIEGGKLPKPIEFKKVYDQALQ